MKKPLSLFVFLLALAPLARADAPIPAQPITLSLLAGTDQSDFFFSSSASSPGAPGYVVFTGALPQRDHSELRNLFSVKVCDLVRGTAHSYITVGKAAPLKKLASYKVPAPGTDFDTFLASDNSVGKAYWRMVFRVPGQGLFMTTNGAAPRNFYADKSTGPFGGAALRFPGNQPTDPDAARQFRVIFSGADKKKGVEPFLSTGVTPTTKLLSDIVPGLPSSNPSQFIAFGGEVFFVATNPATHAPDIYKVSVSTTNPRLPAYSAVKVTSGLSAAPQQLTGSGVGLFYTSTPSGAPQSLLYRSADGITFNPVLTDDTTPAQVTNATELTPAIDTTSGEFAFSAYDNATGTTRLAVYDTLSNRAQYPDVAGATVVQTTAPTHITSTGSCFYYSTTVSGASASRLARVFTGSSDVEFISAVTAGNFVRNVREIVDVPGLSFTGKLYFTADAFVDGAEQLDILFSMTADSSAPIATPVRTIANHLVQEAHNLRPVAGTGGVGIWDVFRLYFSAPVNDHTNSEYAAGGTDYDNKPWVVNAP